MPYRRVCSVFFKLYGCWCVCSLLVQPPLSHLPLLISMETGPGAFSHIHTLAINQQVRPGSIPTHTHHTHENKDYTDTTPNHRNIPEHTLLHLDHSSCLRGSDLATQFFSPSNLTIYWHLNCFIFKWWLLPRGTVSEHEKICSHQLFSLLSSRDELACIIVWICCLICLAIMNGSIERKNVFPWTDNVSVSGA